jgi:hypothetical protein
MVRGIYHSLFTTHLQLAATFRRNEYRRQRRDPLAKLRVTQRLTFRYDAPATDPDGDPIR